MTALSVLTAAQSRIDDGCELPGDREAAARLDVRCQAGDEQRLAAELEWERQRYEQWRDDEMED